MENKYLLFVVLGVVAEMSLHVSGHRRPLPSFDYAPPPFIADLPPPPPPPPCAAALPPPPYAGPSPVPVSLLPVPTPLPIKLPRQPCPSQSVTIPNIILALLPPTPRPLPPAVRPYPPAVAPPPAPIVLPIPQPKPYFVPSSPLPPPPCN